MKKIQYINLLLICTSLQAQIVNIPDPNFKNALVNTPCVIFGPQTNDCGDVNIHIDFNGDGEVQVSEAEVVTFLCLGFQNITSLVGIEAFVNLEYLYVYNNNLTTIDTSQNLLLKILDCDSNNLSSINITQNTVLEVLGASYNELTQLDISNNINLKSLFCGNNQLNSIDISNNPQLTSMSIGFNELTTVDLSQHPNFAGLGIKNNQLTSIDVSQNPLLKSLNIGQNNLTTIDLSQNPILERLLVKNNTLTTIDLSHNPLLKSLSIGGNSLPSFNISNNTLLETLVFSDSPLITGNIDLSQHSVLWDLRCENTSISGLNIKNGDAQLPYEFDAFNNPNLFCIQVDDAQAASQSNVWPYSEWEIDPQVTFSEACELGVEEQNIAAKLVLSPNPVKNSFTISTKLVLQEIKIFNLQGKLLYQKVKPNNTLNISNLASGILLLQFTTDAGIITKKMVKQ